jgi:hypothetical protein
VKFDAGLASLADEEEEVKYLIMFDLLSDHANIVETYMKHVVIVW